MQKFSKKFQNLSGKGEKQGVPYQLAVVPSDLDAFNQSPLNSSAGCKG